MRNPLQLTPAIHPESSDAVRDFASCFLRVLAFVCWAFVVLPLSTDAQPPGSDPPTSAFPQPDRSEETIEQLRIRAFLFMSEAKSPVVMPDMTWEELERLQSLDVGTKVLSQLYSYDSIDVTGKATGKRAELTVTVKLSLDSTNGRWVPIPLRMGNFHRLAPPDVTGVDDYFMTMTPDGGGYLLWVRTKTRREVTMQMGVSARVDTASAQSLEFQLPDAPSTVTLVTEGSDVTGDVTGQGYESLDRPKRLPGGRTEFLMEGVGGTFTFRWGKLQGNRKEVPELEVVSRMTVNWESPQEQPRAVVELTVLNVQTSIASIDIRFPKGTTVPENATLGDGGQSVAFGPAIPDAEGERRSLLIPDQERQSRLDLNFSYNMPLPGRNVSASKPLRFRAPEVIGALRHRGEITVQTPTDYRLRWITEPGVRNVFDESAAETTSGRSYSFQFDRDSFNLMLWLSAKERQVRVTSSSRLSFQDSTARLEMLIESSDRAADGRGPQIDMAGWSIETIENADTGESIKVFQGDGFPEIDLPNLTGSPPPIKIVAQQTFDSTDELIVIAVPRIVKTDDGLLVPTSTVEVVNRGRSILIVDLEASENLERIETQSADSGSESVSRYRVDSHESTALIVGRMVEQPPRITLACDGIVFLDGDRLQTSIDWTVTSQLDLEGTLPIRVPKIAGIAGASDSGTATSTAGSDDPTQWWSVTVGGEPAALQPVNETRFDLVSPRLNAGTLSIRFTRTQQIDLDSIGDSFELLSLPRPAVDGVTIRDVIRIALRGTAETELLSPGSTSVNEIVLDSLPAEPVRLRMRKRETQREDLTISQVILRTAVGRSTRHEQVLARVQGGDAFKVRLPGNSTGVSVEALIDGETKPVRREGELLVLQLPGDEEAHVVDLRVWVEESREGLTTTIEPTLRLPVEVGRVYWQIVVPLDSHLIWASPTMGRSMRWSFDRWKLERSPSHDDRALTMMAGSLQHAMPPGHDYLYVGSDVRSFQVVSATRVVLWIAVGMFVLLVALLLTHLPQSRHPLTAVVAATLFAGLLAIAPDAAVLVGQLAVIALVLVIIMIAVRSLVTPKRSDRIVSPRESRRRPDGSTHSLPTTHTAERRSSVSRTRSIPPSPSEISS